MNDDDQQDLVELTEEMSLLQEIRDDMYKMIPALRAAIARDSSFEAMDTRLKKLEAERSSFPQWKMASDIHKFRVRMLHTSMPDELKESIDEEITKILDNQGFRKFGEVGEAFDELKHRVVDMKDDRGSDLFVNQVISPGLTWMKRVVLKADVVVSQRRKGK
ncbi:MAG: nucleotide exchange factor GrpE [Actinomycetes bacterium]